MTRRQANTIVAGIIAVILTQLLCTALLPRRQERARRHFDAAQENAVSVTENQSAATDAPELATPTGAEQCDPPEPAETEAHWRDQRIQLEMSRNALALEVETLEAKQAEIEALTRKAREQKNAAIGVLDDNRPTALIVQRPK